MIRGGLLLAISFLFLLLTACASFNFSANNNSPKLFRIEREWARNTLAAERYGSKRVHRMSPLVTAKQVIAGNAIDGIVSYDRITGTEMWRLDIKGGVEGGGTVDGDHLFFGAGDGMVYCVQASTGKVIWSFNAKAETLAPPTLESGVVYVETGADSVYALDSGSGKMLWVYNRQLTSNFSIRGSTKPVILDGLVYLGFSDGYFVALRTKDGGLAWEKKLGFGARFRDVDATPVFEGESIYVSSFDGSLYCLAKKNGDILWQLDEGGYTPVTMGTDGSMYFSSTKGRLLRIDRASGKIIWAKNLSKGLGTQPVLFKGYLVVGESDGPLFVLQASSGKEVTRFDPGFGVMAKPTVNDATGETFLMSNGANLYALKLGLVRPAERMPWFPQ